MTLLVRVNCPGSQEHLVSNWSLLAVWWRMWSLGPRLSLSSSGCRPPASLLLVGYGPVCSWLALLLYSLSSLFCEWAWQCLRLELLAGKFSLCLSFFFSLWLSHSLGCCLTFSSVQFSRSVVSNCLRPHESQHVPSYCLQGIQAWSLP